MGAVRIVGKVFKVVGEVLTAEAVEKWVEDKIEDFVTGKIKDAASAAAEQDTASRELASVLDVAGPFHVALENSLGQLPKFCVEAAQEIAASDIDTLCENLSGDNYVVAVPRDLISSRFQKFMTDELKDSVQLSEFPGLIDTALSTVARDAEAALFTAATDAKTTELDLRVFIVGTELVALWKDSQLKGHYYITNSRLAKFGFDDITKAIAKLRDRIGRLPRPIHTEIIKRFYL